MSSPSSFAARPHVCIALAGLLIVLTAQPQAQPMRTPGCTAVDHGSIEVDGREFRQAPDLLSPELRLISAMLDARCRTEAAERLRRYSEGNADDYQRFYLEARLAISMGDEDRGHLILRRLLRAHPDFLSAKSLLASRLIQRGETEEGGRLLAELETEAPTDITAAFRRWSIDPALSPAEIGTRFLPFATQPKLSGSLREFAAQQVRKRSGDPRLIERVLRDQLTYESETPNSMKSMQLVWFLADEGRSEEVLGLLGALEENPNLSESVKIWMAQVYLSEAGRISLKPVDANRPLIDRALAIVGGDVGGLRASLSTESRWSHLSTPPHLNHLLPLLPQPRNEAVASGRDADPICLALEDESVAGLQSLIEQGADPNAQCSGHSLIKRVIVTHDTPTALQMRAKLELLLRAGALVTDHDIRICESEISAPACREHGLDLLRSHMGQRP